MKEYPKSSVMETPAFRILQKFIAEHRSQSAGEEGSFEEFEREIHRLFQDCEREVLAEELASFDVKAPYVIVEGVRYRKALRAAETYVGQAGPLRVERNLYQPVGGGRTICPLELRAGIVGGSWTPRAARIMATVVAEVPPNEAENLIKEFGGMNPSASSLDRLPKQLSERWEENRCRWEDALRQEISVPQAAASIVISLDGVHVPLKKKEIEECQESKNGYREASCGTVSYLDSEGRRLSTTRFGRMPETKKKTLKGQLSAEFEWAMKERPNLWVIKIADGAPDNWEFLRELGGEGVEILDFYHAATHLKNAADAVYGAETSEAKALFESWKTTLKEDPRGAEKVIRALNYRRDAAKGAARKVLATELNYFRSQRGGMLYQRFKAENWPIGSGVVEAACKTVVSERLKQSGMRWSLKGGQAILTLRSLIQSDRWEAAWRILAKSYRESVSADRQPVRRAG
jgi:hypothetical protein